MKLGPRKHQKSIEVEQCTIFGGSFKSEGQIVLSHTHSL